MCEPNGNLTPTDETASGDDALEEMLKRTSFWEFETMDEQGILSNQRLGTRSNGDEFKYFSLQS